jgi:5-dehydro-2-deoxygluconokinase
MLTDPVQVQLTHSQVSDARVAGDVQSAITGLLALGPRALVEKRGGQGARVHFGPSAASSAPVEAPGFPVEVANILGAGDAFASGFLFGHIRGWDWRRAARLGNACGAIVVTRHGCANFMPTYDEVMAFVGEHGGL